MKQGIGATVCLYPMPALVVGAMVDGKPNWLLAAFCGILDKQHILVSLSSRHYTNQGIIREGAASVSLIHRENLALADLVGSVSGRQSDKSQVFAWESGCLGEPVPQELPLTMECKVTERQEWNGFDCFVMQVENTLVDPAFLTDGKVDYHKLKPVLFEMPGYTYLASGETIGSCGKQHRAQPEQSTEEQ